MANQNSLSGPLSRFWLVAWSLTLALGWLLPNHYPPWSSFHFDAWVAAAMLPVSLATILLGVPLVRWNAISLLVAGLALLLALQYQQGLIALAGNAWVCAGYLFGFLLALVTGARWAAANEDQPADGVFLAIGIAAMLSVGLQLHQWLELDRLDIWSMGQGYGRPFANFGQPNQLGTFLLWALLATGWGYVRNFIGARTSIFVALYLLFGLALTASRTAWIALFLVVVAAWAWRRLWPSSRLPMAITCLAAYFVVCVISIGWINQLLQLGSPYDGEGIARITGELRPAVWSLFVDAALQRPLFGYGWNQVGLAEVMASTDRNALHQFFSQSHNLFLDLVLWCGIPVGLTVSAFLIWWFLRHILAVRRAEDALLLLLLIVVANHAMLELPLHYAYFLLPTGLVMGALDARMGARAVFVTGRWAAALVWLFSSAVLALIIRDYRQVESSYQTLRFEWANVKTLPAQTPDVVLLTQWRDYFRLIRLEPTSDMSDAELAWIENVTMHYPNIGFFQKLATALAMNRRPEEAAIWLTRMCRIAPESQCRAVKAAWAIQVQREVVLTAVPWPKD